MYKGESSNGIDFFNLLMASDEFNQELGQVTLAAGRLETELIKMYIRKGLADNFGRMTMGRLIQFGEDNNLLNTNLTVALRMVCKQRNYITHNIYALFSDLIEETLLPKADLIDTDVLTYIEKIWETKRNLSDLSIIISDM